MFKHKKQTEIYTSCKQDLLQNKMPTKTYNICDDDT